MKHWEFEVGQEFRSGDKTFRCTDIGKRTITAIRVDMVDITQMTGGRFVSKTLDRDEAEAEGWFAGPPYAVAELVFDEDGIKACKGVDQHD